MDNFEYLLEKIEGYELSKKDIKNFNSKNHKFYKILKYFKENSDNFVFYFEKNDVRVEVGEYFYCRISLVLDIAVIQYYWKDENYLVSYPDERSYFLLKEILKYINFKKDNISLTYNHLNYLIKEFSKRKYVFSEEIVSASRVDFDKKLFFELYNNKIESDKLLRNRINNIYKHLLENNLFEDVTIKYLTEANIKYINKITENNGKRFNKLKEKYDYELF